MNGDQQMTALYIMRDGTARMAQDGTDVLQTGDLVMYAQNTANHLPGSVLDLADNDLIVQYGDYGTIAQYLANGYDNGTWLGENTTGLTPACIISSVAAADPTQTEALGHAQIGTDTAHGELNLTTFDGVNVNLGDVVVKFTYYGDANLDGNVDLFDASILQAADDKSLGWSEGAFDYQAGVDDRDTQMLAASMALNLPAGYLQLPEGYVWPTLPATTPAGVSIDRWLMNWGDGNGAVAFDPDAPATWPRSNSGFFHTALTALDSGGNPIDHYAATNVQFVPPSGSVISGVSAAVLGDNITATAMVLFAGEVGTFTTSAPPDIVAEYDTATILWGDGNSTPGTIVPDGGALYSVDGSYTYDAPGIAPLQIQIDDGSGDPATAVGSANVADYLAVGTAATAVLESEGVTVDLDALGNDAAGPDQITYSWSVTGAGGASVVFDDNGDNSAQSTFATLSAAGTYTFPCVMSNPSGQSVSSSSSLEVDQAGAMSVKHKAPV